MLTLVVRAAVLFTVAYIIVLHRLLDMAEDVYANLIRRVR